MFNLEVAFYESVILFFFISIPALNSATLVHIFN